MRAASLIIALLSTNSASADFPDPRTIPADQRIAYVNRVANLAGEANVKPHYDRAIAEFKNIYNKMFSGNDIDSPEWRAWENVTDNLSTLAVRPDWTTDEARILAAWISANKEALNALRLATDGDAYYEPLEATKSRLWRAAPPEKWTELFPFRKLLAIQANHSAIAGRWDEAVESNRRLRRLAVHMRQQPLAIQSLVGLSVERLAYEQILSWARHGQGPVCARLLKELMAARPESCPIKLSTFAEDLYVLDYLEAFHAWAHDPESEPDMQEAVDSMFLLGDYMDDEPLPGLNLAPRYESSDALRVALLESDIENSWRTLFRLKKHFAAWDAKPFHEAWTIVGEFRAVAIQINESDPALRFCNSMIDPDQIRYLRAVTRAQRTGTIVALAILDHKARAGRLPESLASLAGQSPKLDTVDVFTGKRLRYVLTDSGRDFRLYSIGPDLVDDGGKKIAEGKGPGDIVYWPVTLPERYDRNLDYEQD